MEIRLSIQKKAEVFDYVLVIQKKEGQTESVEGRVETLEYAFHKAYEYAFEKRTPIKVFEEMTARQMQIVKMLALGLNMQQVSAELGLTYGTVKRHLYEARERTGARTNLMLVYYLVRLGYL